MRMYDYKKAKRLIEENASDIVSASLGMHEDWFWTAETIWENGTFTESFLSLKKGDLFGGIAGSVWATPALSLECANGDRRMIPVFTGKPSDDGTRRAIVEMGRGVMSGPCQDAIPALEVVKPRTRRLSPKEQVSPEVK